MFFLLLFEKGLSDVGKDLPTRVGDSEANRDKNRYPYILPCKCRLRMTQVIMQIGAWFCFSLPAVDHCRVRLSVQNSLPHSDYINANFVPVSVGSVFLMFRPRSLKPVVFAFRVEDRRETSSAPRGLCRAPWPTSGGWCGSKTSGWSSWWQPWGTKTRWGRRRCSVSKPLQTLSAALPFTQRLLGTHQKFHGWVIKYFYLFASQVLCEKYWPPEGGTVYYGLIQVTTLSCKQGPDFFITSINLRQVRWWCSHGSVPWNSSGTLLSKAACVNGAKEKLFVAVFQRDSPTPRTIKQYYYPSWPDRGVPKEPSSLCTFTEHVRQDLEASPRLGPAVVHCRCDLQPIHLI